MIINHNLQANNALRNMSINSNSASKAMEKLSSGLRINRAGDDAAGLAISEKMRGQINGLNQASSNSQDAISMIQTAEGALNETHSILQRMRTLAVQAGNDTNVTIDRGEIQKEINQLSSEINRIGNTTEFNTQALLKGDSKVNLEDTGLASLQTDVILSNGKDTVYTQAKQTIAASSSIADTSTLKVTLNGQTLTLTVATANTTTTLTSNNAATIGLGHATAQTGAGNADIARKALQELIDSNSSLKGNYTVTGSGANIVITANADGAYAGAAGVIGAATSTNFASAASYVANTGTTDAAINATASISFGTLTAADVKDLLGKGITINGQQIEFYNANEGAYTGDALGINISDAVNTAANWATAVVTDIINQAGSKLSGVTLSAGTTANVLKITASEAGAAGNSLKVTDGGIQKAFQATFQVGANQGQQFTIDVNDMRSIAIGITSTEGAVDSKTGAKFVATNIVTNGTDSIVREASLDVSNATNATNAVKTINNAIEAVSSERSKLGAFQNRLEHTINNLGTSSENLTSAESRIRDVNMAQEMSEYSKNNILSQAAQAMLAQANQQPQQVLQLLR